MVLRLHLRSNHFANIISCYAPTVTHTQESKNKLHEDITSLASSILPQKKKLILIGDFNARVGTDHQTWKGVLGTHGLRNCDSSVMLLLQFCTINQLLLKNTSFRLPENRTSWMYPRSKHWHLIDYIIVHQRDRHDVCVAKSMYHMKLTAGPTIVSS